MQPHPAVLRAAPAPDGGGAAAERPREAQHQHGRVERDLQRAARAVGALDPGRGQAALIRSRGQIVARSASRGATHVREVNFVSVVLAAWSRKVPRSRK